MAKLTLAAIKSLFTTGKIVSQGQFHDTWDSFVHKDDTIETSQINGLDAILATIPTSEQIQVVTDSQPTLLEVVGSDTFTLEAGKILWKIALDATATGLFKIGTSSGGSEIYEESLTDGDMPLWIIEFRSGVEETIHFTGNADLKIYLQ